uniref:Transmembrane protein 235b n=1 Tax=Callorhinchus milii TaxID=7868 RepID=A0A4W3K835_CALMI
MMNVGAVCVIAGCAGLLSFVFLAVAIGTDYWYVIDVSKSKYNTEKESDDLSSHSGLWRICQGKGGQCVWSLMKVCVILLPLSLVLLVFGGICGLVSSLANDLCMLLFTGSYFLVGGTLTLTGITVYIAYSKAAFAEVMCLYDHRMFDDIDTSFSWSMGLAWLSFTLEIISGALLLLAAKLNAVRHSIQSVVI